MIKKYLANKTELIETELNNFIDSKSQEALALDLDCLTFLKEFVVSGKLYRGGFVFLGYDLFAQEKSEKLKPESAQFQLLLSLAMLVELTHSAFLLHDDVMDQDDLRRGSPTFHKLAANWAKQQKLENAGKVGESLAVCLGDLLIFWGNSLLTQALLIYSDAKLAQAISSFYYREMEFTAWGQMDDVVLAASSGATGQELIMNVLSLKSGHYSVVNPLLLGAMVGCHDQSQLNFLKQAALNLGIVFQIKDDLLNLLGNSDQTGKAVGSDIKENKKTLYRNKLFELANPDDLEQLQKLFGNRSLTQDQLQQVRALLKKYQVVDVVDQQVERLKQRAQQAIEKLELDERGAQLMQEIADLLTERNK